MCPPYWPGQGHGQDPPTGVLGGHSDCVTAQEMEFEEEETGPEWGRD